MARDSIYDTFSIALLTFAFNEIQRWKVQLKKSLGMLAVGDTFCGYFLKQST